MSDVNPYAAPQSEIVVQALIAEPGGGQDRQRICLAEKGRRRLSRPVSAPQGLTVCNWIGPPNDYLNDMQKPPFQFGLKAAFVATVGAAVLASLTVPPEAAESGAALAVIAAIALVGVLSLAVVVAFALSVSLTLYHLIEVCRQFWRKLRAPGPEGSSTLQNPVAAARREAVG